MEKAEAGIYSTNNPLGLFFFLGSLLLLGRPFVGDVEKDQNHRYEAEHVQ